LKEYLKAGGVRLDERAECLDNPIWELIKTPKEARPYVLDDSVKRPFIRYRDHNV